MTFKKYINQKPGLFIIVSALLLSWAVIGPLSNHRAGAASSATQASLELDSYDLEAAQDIIRAQLSAIRKRDARLIYATATNNFHALHDDSDQFLKWMRYELRPLYNHDRVRFEDSYVTKDGFLQKVTLHDLYETPVSLIFNVKKQENGQWLIDSFTQLDQDAQAI